MEINSFLTAIIGGIFGIAGTYLGYHLSLSVAETQAKHAETLAAINARRIAGAKLRAAFAPAISKYALNINRGDKWTILMMQDMLTKALPRHAAAIEEYRCFIPHKSQAAYQQAWENYKSDFLEYYDTDAGQQTLFKERINAIFIFTEI